MKQLATYFSLACLISWLIWLPLYGPVLGLADLPVLPFHHGLGGLGPLIASFLTTWIWKKQSGIRQLLRSCFQVRPVVYLAIALLSPFVLAVLATAINSLANGTPFELSGLLTYREFPDFGLPAFFVYNLVFFGFGEEAGWRGFALPRIQAKFNALTSTLILTFFWALWHWPLFFYRPGYTSMDIGGIIGWLFSLLTGSVLLTWLFNASRGSILVCAVFHATIDIAFTADYADQNIANYMGFLITLWGILAILYFKPGNLAGIDRQRENCYGSGR
ncbi:type II CAAX endopeptidase family protein [Robiginitalea sp. SC105]|uniref:type II CAAX endopeptidase family protein n=1 Tax=Robiginitalea sp. SC105 TaxID=2762332 RepID=UPI00163A67DE|nr:type II CAAX endopeptidase family protein [Robiginitalea sp. SC105]MBC2838692.1 CPBP family intramembrane metalloprotease [Robiginitalea sp. SC105]